MADLVAASLNEPGKVAAGSEDEEALAGSAEWLYTTNLLYELPPVEPGAVRCFRRGCASLKPEAGEGEKASGGACAACGMAWYCSKDCQRKDWKRAHKHECKRFKPLLERPPQFHRRATVVRLLRKIRLYACPFAVAKQHSMGPGFLLLQSPNTLLDFCLLGSGVSPVTNQPFDRSVVLNFFTVGDFKETTAKDDFELLPVIQAVEAALAEGTKADEKLIMVSRFRCGHICVLRFPLVPDRRICNVLAGDYMEMETLQLNIEEE